jgi:hypothetical protein
MYFLMVNFFRLFFIVLPIAGFCQGSVEVSYGRTVYVEVIDSTTTLQDFVINHCCTSWKWGSNKILVLGKDENAVYAVTSSSVKDGSDEEVEINLVRTDFKGITSTIKIFKHADGMKFDSIVWKSMVIEELDKAESDFNLSGLDPVEVKISSGDEDWIAKVENKENKIEIAWIFETDTDRGHDYYFSWKVEVKKIIQKK